LSEKVHALVTDGLTIGHPCCNVRHCDRPLLSNRDHYCSDHAYREQICAVEYCEQPVESDFKTCSDLNHRALEAHYKNRNKAMFQLKARMHRAQVAHPNDASAAEAPLDETEHAELPKGAQDVRNKADMEKDQGKPETGNRKLHLLFGRRRTHNEQIMVRPCGIIIQRATFFGSETVTQVVDMIKKTFKTRNSQPETIFYDNNCGVYKHLEATGDPINRQIGLPVDVFHWECKHKKSNIECSYHCNPHAFPELIAEDGRSWVFNSSAAEQTNVWLGGYHAIIREMNVVLYNFFLDEIIMRRNEKMIKKLEQGDVLVGTIPNAHFTDVDEDLYK
ncbi:hypothetical protein OE88DRAFT_1778248, partial [Heliocybe sulcata]